MMMNLSLFLTIYISSILFLLAFHIIFLGMWYMGLLAPVAGRRPDILTIIQNCAVTSVACCVLYSHCGDYATSKGRLFERRNFGWFSIWKKEEPLLNKFMHMNEELKDRVCSSWFALLGSASDYPVLSEWVIYEKLACNGSCPRILDNISPIYSLWLTIIGLYIANYVVGRSAGWALTHPLPVEVDNELKAKPDFLDMVPWYSGTSADLFKAVFDLLVSVTIFVGGFDMRVMQAHTLMEPVALDKVVNMIHYRYSNQIVVIKD
ncbi:hypothetical protein NE237_018941 [Protea cynaroides]|uniref:Uncharacterized protein n=1 Tax=Protea cynaroides TaxID=273540 RepID=A0A9Q0QPG6_9MAGN|nr:hypothetical protein NE237_018941 [Protea cynaroides]